jgi:hypothetical protein
MKFSEISENVKIVISTPRTTSWCRATRKPAVSRRNPCGSSGLSTGAGKRTDSSAAITNTKLTPLTMNTAGAPKAESRDAPSTGPTTREVFICAEWSDTAPGRSSRHREQQQRTELGEDDDAGEGRRAGQVVGEGPSTTFWVQMPVLDRKALANIRRNTGWLSAAEPTRARRCGRR